jgi:hypothetical protein
MIDVTIGAVLEHKEATQQTPTGPRSLRAIAREIRRVWPKVYFGAVPYLDAMSQLDSISDKYLYDDARSIVLYFLSNATTWKGDDARRIKAELKALLGRK